MCPTSHCTTWLGPSEFTGGARTALEAASKFKFARLCVQLAKNRMKLMHERMGTASHLYEIRHCVRMSVKANSLHPTQRGKVVPKCIGSVTAPDMVGRNVVSLGLPA